MKALASRFIALGLALMLAVSPVLAQDAPDSSTTDQSQAQPTGQDQDQAASPTDTTSSVDSSPTPAAADPAAVIAQWGPAPNIGPDADNAVAQRWFREQNTKRGRWGVPTATRDPYLDWVAENYLRDHLDQPHLPQPQGITQPAVVQRSQSDQAILGQPEFWTVSDDLWQAWLDTFEAQPPDGWSDARPGEPWFSRDNYLLLFRIQKTPRFDRFRLMGVAGRLNTSNSQPAALLSGESRDLEAIAPGAMASYEPVAYPDNLVSVVGYDPWINPDGSLRP
ncbi:MAG: hypothetical protein M3069_32320 [Chloroflexota bacterium]|nr:hypothetical protein [Chloroflexota bacterium]